MLEVIDCQETKRAVSERLEVDRYGSFKLTPAVRPWIDKHVVPREGYRVETFRDESMNCSIPMLAASVSRERLFDVFVEFLDELGPVADVVLESYHHLRTPDDNSIERIRENIDLAVLKSYCFEHEDLLMEDGCFGMAVINPAQPCEIQFDDHKVLAVYAKDLTNFMNVLSEYGVPHCEDLRLISEGEHLHSTCQAFADDFDSFCQDLNID